MPPCKLKLDTTTLYSDSPLTTTPMLILTRNQPSIKTKDTSTLPVEDDVHLKSKHIYVALRTIVRQVYLCMLFRLPLLYSSRVDVIHDKANIVISAMEREVSLPTHGNDKTPTTRQSDTLRLLNEDLGNSWQLFIDDSTQGWTPTAFASFYILFVPAFLASV